MAKSNGAAVKPEQNMVTIPPLRIGSVRVPITGLTPLLVHCWSEKAKKAMLDKQMKRAKEAKAAKDPEEDVRASRYVSDAGWDGFPATGLKAALVGACRSVDGLAMTTAKRMVYVLGDGYSTAAGFDLVRIFGEPAPNEAMVRLETGVADIRYRAVYLEWSAVLNIEFNAALISQEQVVNLVQLAGHWEGIGEWRPSSPKSSTGTFGRFCIPEKEVV